MATKEQLSAAIEPGSTEYGTRGQLESMLPSGGGAPAGGPGPGPGGELPAAPSSPIDMMMSGDFEMNPDVPPTSGLSVGAGPGPTMEESGASQSTYAERLRAVASGAKSPALRAQARQALKALYVQGRL